MEIIFAQFMESVDLLALDEAVKRSELILTEFSSKNVMKGKPLAIKIPFKIND